MSRQRFLAFLDAMDQVLAQSSNEPDILNQGEAALRDLIAHDDWLPAEFAAAKPDKHQQYLLYVDPAARYSVQSFVWDAGQGTPVHNHTVWGLVGVMRGAERCEEYAAAGASPMRCEHTHLLAQGEVDRVSPSIGDWHAVKNALADAPSISIHVYGADIGRVTRSVWEPATGQSRPFVSGYSNTAPWISQR
jgi:predicted metal-dependent enzyme (double-stranded beta helix superfamily)